jgi:lipopolysaccharide biosynthesis glycosyltransferase
MSYRGEAIWLDGDMVVTTDITQLFGREYRKAVRVVQHDYKTKHKRKFLGQENEDYPRKNWSSVIAWDCSHYGNRRLTPDYIEKATGEELHRFSWLRDEEIGILPLEWNWLSDEYGINGQAKVIHYTAGIPAFSECMNNPMADKWHREFELTTNAS